MITGIFLSCFYIPSAGYAEISLAYIIAEVHNGAWIQRIHVIGASLLFILLYSHFFRAIFYSMFRYSNRLTWWTGLILLYLIIIESFTGYILPWGQMSFWGATVITNLFSIIPIIGTFIVKLIWGGSIVGGLTLQRFFMFHYIIPSIIISIFVLHLASLHKLGSTHTGNYNAGLDLCFLQLYPYFIIKDLLYCILALFLLLKKGYLHII